MFYLLMKVPPMSRYKSLVVVVTAVVSVFVNVVVVFVVVVVVVFVVVACSQRIMGVT